MRWCSLNSLDSVTRARLHEFAMLFCSIWRPGRAAEGGKRYQMAAYTSARRSAHTIDISEAVNHRESAILAPGRHDRRPEHNPARGLFIFWRRVRAALEADRGPTGDQRPPQKAPPGSCTPASAIVEYSPNTSSASDPHSVLCS